MSVAYLQRPRAASGEVLCPAPQGGGGPPLPRGVLQSAGCRGTGLRDLDLFLACSQPQTFGGNEYKVVSLLLNKQSLWFPS